MERRGQGWSVIISQNGNVVEEIGPFDHKADAEERAAEKGRELGLL